MHRLSIVVGALLFVGSACTGAGSGSVGEVSELQAEQAQRFEESEGDERSMEGTNPGEMEGWMPPNAEEDEEMESEPYPE